MSDEKKCYKNKEIQAVYEECLKSYNERIEEIVLSEREEKLYEEMERIKNQIFSDLNFSGNIDEDVNKFDETFTVIAPGYVEIIKNEKENLKKPVSDDEKSKVKLSYEKEKEIVDNCINKIINVFNQDKELKDYQKNALISLATTQLKSAKNRNEMEAALLEVDCLYSDFCKERPVKTEEKPEEKETIPESEIHKDIDYEKILDSVTNISINEHEVLILESACTESGTTIKEITKNNKMSSQKTKKYILSLENNGLIEIEKNGEQKTYKTKIEGKVKLLQKKFGTDPETTKKIVSILNDDPKGILDKNILNYMKKIELYK